MHSEIVDKVFSFFYDTAECSWTEEGGYSKVDVMYKFSSEDGKTKIRSFFPEGTLTDREIDKLIDEVFYFAFLMSDHICQFNPDRAMFDLELRILDFVKMIGDIIGKQPTEEEIEQIREKYDLDYLLDDSE